MTRFRSGRMTIVLSDLTLRELENAPPGVKEALSAIPEPHRDYITLGDEARALSERYIREGGISERFRLDAQHIAMATISRSDVLVSWNFKHIVNLRRIRLYNAVNLRNGYPVLEIRSPREVLHDEEEV